LVVRAGEAEGGIVEPIAVALGVPKLELGNQASRVTALERGVKWWQMPECTIS